MYSVGKIDEDGKFWIERRGTLTRQICPYSSLDGGDKVFARNQLQCGDHCPLFGPFFGNVRGGDLYLCHGKKLSFKIFTKCDGK